MRGRTPLVKVGLHPWWGGAEGRSAVLCWELRAREREMHREKEQSPGCQKVGGDCFMGTGSLLGRQNILELDSSDGARHRGCSSRLCIVHLKVIKG